MLSGGSGSELSAELVEFFLGNSKSSDSSFCVSVKFESCGCDFLLEEVRLLVVAADCDSSAMLGWGLLSPAVCEVPSDDPPELGASVVLHNIREHLTDSVPSLEVLGVLPSFPCVEGMFVGADDARDALRLDPPDRGARFRHDGGDPSPPSEMSESHVSNDDLLDGDESSICADDGSCCEARVAAREDVHQSTKLCEVEGLEIRPDRCWVQESRFHFRDQVRDGEGFDLTNSDCAQASDSSAESEINSTVPGAQANMICFGMIHIHFPSVSRRWRGCRSASPP